jgi:hypothetical protein
VIHPFATTGWDQLSSLADVVKARAAFNAPQLIFAHITLPHPPLNLTAECEFRNEAWRNGLTMPGTDEGDRERRFRAYADQTLCVQRTLVEQLRSIRAALADTHIFAFGDHGPDGSGQLGRAPETWTDGVAAERFGTLVVSYTGEPCRSAVEAATIVNAVRAFTACTLDVEVPPIPDRQFITPAMQASEIVVEWPALTE